MRMTQTAALKEQALESIKSSELGGAKSILDTALKVDWEDKEVRVLLMYVNYWLEKMNKLRLLEGAFEQADAIMGLWSGFLQFTTKIGESSEHLLYPFRIYVFSSAINMLKNFDNREGSRNPEVLWRMGFACKMLGNYDHALKFLQAALALESRSALILSELADVYALVDEIDHAKLLFREAFYEEAEAVRLDTLESELIRRVIVAVASEKEMQKAKNYWIPIMGKLMGVLNVTRELKASEFAKLKQSIYQVERDYVENPGKHLNLIPLLLNKYFWYIDHAMLARQSSKEIEAYLLKIESLHPEVYKLYTR